MNLRKWARGKDCQVRAPGVCNFDPDTTVLCHINIPGLFGLGLKGSDYIATLGCSSCHDLIDYRVSSTFEREAIQIMKYEGALRTIAMWSKELG